MEIAEYHKTRSSIDYTFIASVFERDERELLAQTIQRYPGCNIRMPNADLIASGRISGIGGVVSLNSKKTIQL